MNKLKVYFAILCDQELIKKSLKIALVVGTLLNIINQAEILLALDFVNIDYIKSLLTYMVPFMVSSYTAVSMKMKFKIGDTTHVNTTLMCKGCNQVIQVHKDEIVPVCTNCKEKTQWRIK
ncbi:nitrate/nitrite transporter NrtS [Arcobacteraceae bacterium]|nr:nitrate/nitrite transporter NrtS [Arcobacteraceae bacterium]